MVLETFVLAAALSFAPAPVPSVSYGPSTGYQASYGPLDPFVPEHGLDIRDAMPAARTDTTELDAPGAWYWRT